jgi:hypothetical protein
MPAPENSGPSNDETSKKKEAIPVPASLAQFLAAERGSARRFVQFLSKGPELTEDDLAQSRGMLDAQPKKMGRVVELTRAAANFVPQPGTLLRWCEEIVRSRDEGLRDWALDPAQDAAAAFRDLLRWAYPVIRGKSDRAKRHLAESCVLVGLSLLIARRGLSPLDALRSLASASPVHGERRGAVALERAATKQLMRVGVKQLFELGRVAALFEREFASAEDARHAAIGLADGLRREKDALEQSRDSLTLQLESLDQKLAERDLRIGELTAEVEGTRTHAGQDLRLLKARFRRQIGERLHGLATDAWDALDTDPPHPNVALERLEMARELIRKELEWLDQSLD